MSMTQILTMAKMLSDEDRQKRIREAKTHAEKQAILDEINKAMEELM